MVEKDGHIFSEMAKRKNALLGLDWSIEPRRGATAEEKNIAAMVQEWFDTLDNLEDIILQAADAIGHGFSCQELEWALEENVWLPSGLICVRIAGSRPVPIAAMRFAFPMAVSMAQSCGRSAGWYIAMRPKQVLLVSRVCIACWSGRTCLKTLPFAIWRNFWRFMACRHGRNLYVRGHRRRQRCTF
jgi:hypothetical protein